MGKRRSNGEGSIFFNEAEDRWIAEIVLPDGKKKRKRNKKQSVVRDWLQTTLNELKQGTYLADSNVTVEEFFNRFLTDVVDKTLKPKTIDSYRLLAAKHIIPFLGKLKLKEVKPHHLQALYSEKLDHGLSRRTVQYIHAVIRRAFNEAVRWELLIKNPADGVTAPRPVKKAPVTLSVAEIKQFLEVVKDHRFYPIYLIAVGCGMREGEILALETKDIDFVSNQISVRRNVVCIRGKVTIGEVKTESSMRSVAMPDFVALGLKPILPQSGLIFRTSNNTPISPRNLLRHFHESLAKAGLSRVKFHSLRHSYASIQLLSGTNPKVVQEALGHSSIQLTLDVYSHLIPTLQKEAAQKMDSLFQ